jgi:hypothetical protein
MESRLNIVCDTQAEAAFAQQYCNQKGYQNVTITETEEYHVAEIEGTSPNFVFEGKYSKISAKLWIVSGDFN